MHVNSLDMLVIAISFTDEKYKQLYFNENHLTVKLIFCMDKVSRHFFYLYSHGAHLYSLIIYVNIVALSLTMIDKLCYILYIGDIVL